MTDARSASPRSRYRPSRCRRNPARRQAAWRQRTHSSLCSREPRWCSGRREPQKTDRYGRVVAYAFAARDGVELSVQAELISAGAARVAARVPNRNCAAELLMRENDARRAKLGLWASPYYDLLNAENPAAVLAEQGHFALVEGKVVSVRESGATIYVNFGRRWTEDFTVTILKRNERSFTAAGLEPKALTRRHIRVRGWIEERGGPWIEAARPEQIEFTDRD